MAVIAQWNGHTFEVGSKLIRGFTDLQVSGGCETTDKNTDKQKYKEHKYGEVLKISLTVHLNALTGVTDVWNEAMRFVQESTEGATDYFYTGGYKLIPAQMMLTKAQVSEVVMMPGRGDEWISADVQLTFEQGTKNDGSSGGGSGGGKKNVKAIAKAVVEKWKSDIVPTEKFKQAQANAKKTIAEAKKASGSGGLAEEVAQVAAARATVTAEQMAATQTARDSGIKINSTTGKSRTVALPGKITPSSLNLGQNKR